MRRDTDAQSTSEPNPTFTFDAAQQYEAMAWSVPGGSAITFTAPASATNGTSTAPDAASYSPGSTKDYLWITIFCADNNTGVTVTGTPTGYSGLDNRWNGNSGGVLLGAGHKATTGTTTENAGAWGLSGSETWIAFTIAAAP
jgi:hypothetical protein